MKQLIAVITLSLAAYSQAGDNRPTAFITSVGRSVNGSQYNAAVNANTLGMSVISSSTYKSGDIYVTVSRAKQTLYPYGGTNFVKAVILNEQK